MRITLPYSPPVPSSRPCRLAASRNAVVFLGDGSLVLRSSTNSIPCMRPIPRTSPIKANRFLNSSSASRSCLPRSAERLGVFSRCMTSIVASTAVIEIGLPPNVEPQRAAVAVGRERVLDAGDLGGQDAPGLLPSDRDRPLAAAGVAVAQRDDLLLAGVNLGQHHGGLVGFGATRREEALLEFPGRV